MPHLFVVSINGADRGDTNEMGWDRLIQTLDRGDFDVYKFLKTLKELGYTGPIGLQCYGIKGDERENLKRSMIAWRKLSARLAAESPQGATFRPALVVPSSKVTLHVATLMPDGVRLKPATAWQLVEIGEKDVIVPAQLVTAAAADGSAGRQGGRLIASIPPRHDAQGPRRFRLEPAKAAAGTAQPGLHFKDVNANSLGLWDGEERVLVYNHGVITNENVPQSDHRRRRGCYVHPVWGLNGEVLTDDFPQDHYHHHGIFWTWPHVGIDGQEYDLWAGSRIDDRFVRWICQEAGPVAAVLAVENGWFVDDKKVMVERVWLRAYKAAGGERSLDIEFTWIPVDRPITLWGAEGKSYGGLTMRFAPRQDTIITAPGDRTTEDLTVTSLPWADLTGQFPDVPTPSGAAVFIHPAHPDYPPTWLTRHYGVLCVGWPGVEPKSFEPGEPIRASYRIWIHKTAVDLEQLKQAYAAYTSATEVKWE